jgi:cell division protein FtsI/penicillin-binding protein 2
VGDRTIHNWNNAGFGPETMTQVLQHSANVGASYVSSLLGVGRFYHYVRAFGMGSPTGVDLSGESPGTLPLPGKSRSWTPVSQFTNSFGQGLTVTSLQLIRAVATVANGGVMMRPQIVQRIVYRGHVISIHPVSQGRVISRQTATTLTNMLVQSAIGGEAKYALVRGYDVVAKTGTASVAGSGGQYLQGVTVASVVGYAPAAHPRFVILVKLDHPRDTIWGSEAAAPVLHNLFQDMFMIDRIPPNPNALYR